MDDPHFYKSLAALGELTSRKHKYRARIFGLWALLFFPLSFGAAFLIAEYAGVRISLYVTLAIPLLICATIAESVARKRMPQLVEEVARDHGVTVEQLRADAKHVDSAQPDIRS